MLSAGHFFKSMRVRFRTVWENLVRLRALPRLRLLLLVFPWFSSLFFLLRFSVGCDTSQHVHKYFLIATCWHGVRALGPLKTCQNRKNMLGFRGVPGRPPVVRTILTRPRMITDHRQIYSMAFLVCT